MNARRASLLATLLAFASAGLAAQSGRLPSAGPQQAPDDATPHLTGAASLGLSAQRAAELQQAIDAHDYPAAEKILLAEIDRDPHSASAGRMLAFAGTIYFLNHDFLNAAIAWKKSAAIAPLDPGLRFSLAMTYIRIGHSDWARIELESLAQHSPRNPLFPYWRGRVDYDAHQYSSAIGHFKHAIELDPSMARAYDNLGLCYYFGNQNALAVESYNKAIELERGSQHPSPWPYLNLAVTQQFLGQQSNAEANLHEALRLDPTLVAAHFQLGTIFEDSGQLDKAVVELRKASRLNPEYPEPHSVLARIYHRLGQQQAAQQEAETYQRLRPHATIP